MLTTSRIIQSHAWFARDGAAFTAPTSGTVGRESKPGASDAVWQGFGILDNLSHQKSREVRDVFAPTPGRIRRYRRHQTKEVLDIKFNAQEVGNLAIQCLWGTQYLGSGATQYNPLEGVIITGWLKIQQYDDNDVLFNTVDLYGELAVTGEQTANDQVFAIPFEFASLHSTLNTGAIAAG